MYDLFNETSYRKYQENISVNDIADVLKENSHFVENWLQHSADQRVISGWYFLKKPDNIYEVGYHKKASLSRVETFTDPYEACATYLKKYLDVLLNL